MGYKVLAINPGSTSTKIALYDDERPLLEVTLPQDRRDRAVSPDIIQLDWRGA